MSAKRQKLGELNAELGADGVRLNLSSIWMETLFRQPRVNCSL